MRLLPCLAMIVTLFMAGCSWSAMDWTAKTHDALKNQLSPLVEKEIKEECSKRKAECSVKGIPVQNCAPLQQCMKWAMSYVASAKALHSGLALMNELLYDLDQVKKARKK